MKPFFKKGYNVTMDNFFTSGNLAENLKAEKTILLGTIRKQRKEVPKIEAMMKDKPLHSSEVYLPSKHSLLGRCWQVVGFVGRTSDKMPTEPTICQLFANHIKKHFLLFFFNFFRFV